MLEAHGTFNIQLTPATAPAEALGSFTFSKTYSGDLVATASGQMLSAGDPKAGNAGYVAIERITGTLAGHAGSFAVMQSGIMVAGSPPTMSGTVVPGSGTAALTGLSGTLTIEPTGGKHVYALTYRLAP